MVSISVLTLQGSTILERLQQLQTNQGQLQPFILPVVVSGSLYAFFAYNLRGLYNYPWQVPGVALRLISTAGLVVAKYVARGCKPLFEEWTLSAELLQGMMRCMYANYGDRMTTPSNVKILLHDSIVSTKKSSAAVAKAHGVTAEYFEFNGHEHIWIRGLDSARKSPKQRFVVVYYHGSGFCLLCPGNYTSVGGLLQTRIRKRLQQKLGHDVQFDILLAHYRKAPEFPHPRGPQDAYTMYKYVLDREKLPPSHVVVMGDSAGAALALTTMLRARDEDPKLMPAAGVLQSPFVDRETKGDERKTPYCILADKAVEGYWNAYIPEKGGPKVWGDASPVHCDLSGLPPTYIQASELDYIVSHSKRLMNKALSDGQTNWKLEIFPNMPHCFIVAPIGFLCHTEEGLDKISEYTATQLARAGKSERN